MTKVALLTSWTILKIKFQYQDSLLPSFSCEKRHQLQDSEKVFVLLLNNLVMMQKNIYFKSQQINLTEIQVEDAINSYPTK